MRTTIFVCYRAGTQNILKTWLASFCRHTRNTVQICVVVADTKSRLEAQEIVSHYTIGFERFPVILEVKLPSVPISRIHGAMLDEAFNQVELGSIKSEFVMTMDSDCFPVADGWLEDLEGMMDNGAKISGILNPWAPPIEELDHRKIEWRIRSQRCWDTTHVACQMIRAKDLLDLMETGSVTFAEGDDTGSLITSVAKKRGWKIEGFKVTRCAKPTDNSDPEFNRYVCLIFGDKIYHHGGFTRIASNGDKPIMGEAYGWVIKEIVDKLSADFLLQDSYCFKFDREEEVSKDKMDLLLGSKTMCKI